MNLLIRLWPKCALVTCTGFEPVNAAVKGRCVKPLHQQAISMAPETGFEPVTNRLTAGCSTAELFRQALINTSIKAVF